MFSNFAVGMTVGGVSTPDPLLIRAPGLNGGVPTPWSAGAFTAASQNHPDYRMSELTAHWKPVGAPTPEFGGISTGGEVMPIIDLGGHVQMNTTNWFMLGISVDSNATGEDNSLLEMMGPNHDPSGDIFSYYASGSQGINTALVDTVRLESSRDQLRLDQILPTPPSSTRSIKNFDYGMGVISRDPQNKAGSMFPVRNCFYFTLTQAWLSQVPNFQLGGQTATASTVYAMTWNASTSPPWSQPAVAFSQSMLFPDDAQDSLEIDALSVDKGSGSWNLPDRVIFSLTPESDQFNAAGWFDQIQVYQRYTMSLSGAKPLMTDANIQPVQTFSQKLGLNTAAEGGDPDNVTGTCGGDPTERYRIRPIVAIATDQLAHGTGNLGFSAMRSCTHTTPGSDSDGEVNDSLHLQVTGMDFFPHMLGFIRLWFESDVPTSGPPGPKTLWGDVWIDPNMVALNALEFSVPLPCAISGKQLRFSAECIGYTPGFLPATLRDSWVLTLEK